MNFNALVKALENLAVLNENTIAELPQKDLALLRKYTTQLESAAKKAADTAKEQYISRYGYGTHAVRNGKDILTVIIKDVSSNRFNQKRFAAENPDTYEAYKETSTAPRMTVK